jgi:serine protease Do
MSLSALPCPFTQGKHKEPSHYGETFMQNLKPPSLILKSITYFLFVLMISAGGVRFALADANDDVALLSRSSKAFTSIVKKVTPAVVHIRVEKTMNSSLGGDRGDDFYNNPFFEQFFGPQFRRQFPPATPPIQTAGAGIGIHH